MSETKETVIELSPVTIGGKLFEKVDDLLQYTTGVLKGRKAGEELSEEEQKVMSDLFLTFYPDLPKKLGPEGAEAFDRVVVMTHTTFETNCFAVKRKDGSVESFSALRCVDLAFGRTFEGERRIEYTPGRVLMFGFDFVCADESRAELKDGVRVVPKDNMREICQKIRSFMAELPGEDGHFVDIVISSQRKHQFALFDRPENAQKALATVKSVPDDKFAIADDAGAWSGRIENVQLAVDDFEKSFWEKYHPRGGAMRGKPRKGAKPRQRPQKPRMNADKEQDKNEIEIVVEKPKTLDKPGQYVYGGSAVQYKVNVTPTFGQKKRQETQVGRAGGPPSIAKRPKLE